MVCYQPHIRVVYLLQSNLLTGVATLCHLSGYDRSTGSGGPTLPQCSASQQADTLGCATPRRVSATATGTPSPDTHSTKTCTYKTTQHTYKRAPQFTATHSKRSAHLLSAFREQSTDALYKWQSEQRVLLIRPLQPTRKYSPVFLYRPPYTRANGKPNK